MISNFTGSYVIWQAGMPVSLSNIKGDEILPLTDPALLKVDPDSNQALVLKVVWANGEVGLVSAWETIHANILVKKIFDTDTTVLDVSIRLYK